MKRLLILLTLSIFLISCGPRVSYTKEFPYLPSYNNMVAKTNETENNETDNVEENENQTPELKKVTYVVKDVDMENALSEYEEILNNDGWKTTFDGKPNMLQVEKDDHTALILIYSKNNEILLDITSK